MAEENPPTLKQYLTCSVCTEIFKDPVSLGCHHSFCASCLQDFWAQAENMNCPVCKRKSSKDIGVNFSMKELAESYAGRQRSDPSDEAQVVCTEPSQRSDPSDEAQVVCTEPSQRSAPSDEARVTRRRRQDPVEMFEVIYTRLKKQTVAESLIRAELHRFLREEEEARVEALREEKDQETKRLLLERKTLVEELRKLELRSSFLREKEEARVKALREEEERKEEIRKRWSCSVS